MCFKITYYDTSSFVTWVRIALAIWGFFFFLILSCVLQDYSSNSVKNVIGPWDQNQLKPAPNFYLETSRVSIPLPTPLSFFCLLTFWLPHPPSWCGTACSQNSRVPSRTSAWNPTLSLTWKFRKGLQDRAYQPAWLSATSPQSWSLGHHINHEPQLETSKATLPHLSSHLSATLPTVLIWDHLESEFKNTVWSHKWKPSIIQLVHNLTDLGNSKDPNITQQRKDQILMKHHNMPRSRYLDLIMKTEIWTAKTILLWSNPYVHCEDLLARLV